MMAIPRFYPPGFSARRCCEMMGQRDLEGVLLTSPENVFYTTGYTALHSSGNPILYALRNRLPFFSYVDQQGAVTLMCWGFSAENVEFGANEVIGFNDFAGATRAVQAFLGKKLSSAARLGIESTCPHYVVNLAREAIGTRGQIVPVDNVMAGLRLIKSDDEIALIRQSTRIIEQTVSELYDQLALGMSRLDLIREAKYRLMRNGATGISHITFSFGQANPEIAIDERLEPNKLVTLDLGGIYNGYCSDNRRYAYAGPAPLALRQRYDLMVTIVDEIGSLLVPGAPYASIFRRTLDLFAAQKINMLARFTHVGHHIGLETEEQWLDNSSEIMVQPGMVINIELYSRTDAGEQIGDEETYVVGQDGPTRISILPREIRSL